MAGALDFATAPQIQVGASEGAMDRAVAPRTNSALQLADTLSELNPKLTQAAGVLVREDQAVQGAAAKKLALQTGGKDLAKAVRDGDITATQNPFFIQDYNREASAVSSQAAFDQLNMEAATWAEKNDPGAFRQKYTEAVQQIGSQYDGSNDTQEGFRATAAQNTQQAFSANVAYNSQRITQERQENLSALTAKAIVQINGMKGGKATGKDVDVAIEPLRQQWFATGGDQATWNKVALQGVLAASFNTHSQNILDASKTMSNNLGGPNGGSIYETLGSAEQIETARYRLVADQRDQLRLGIQERQEKVYEQGLQAQGALFQQFGPRLFTGGVTPDEQTQAAATLAQQFPAAAVSEAFKSAAQVTSSMRELNTNRTAAYESSSSGAAHIGSLFQEATQRGWSPELQTELGQLVLQGAITTATQQQLTDTADRTTAKMSNTGAMGANFNAKNQAKNIKLWSQARESITSRIATAFNAANRAGHVTTPLQMQQIQDNAISAASTWLEIHPGDFKGAQLAAFDAVREK